METPPISMRQMRADYRWSATFPQIKPTKINLSLFGRERCPNEHVGFPDRAARAGNPPPRTERDSFCVGFAEMCSFWDTPGGVVC